MGIHTTDAIVLRQYPYRETSALVTCLTDRFGKLKGLIKGLRDGRARHRSAMEPLTLNRIVFYDTRASSLHLISQCELLESFPALTRELAVMRVAASCASLIDAVVEPDEPQPMLFSLLHETLGRLVASPIGLPAIRIHFVMRVLKLIGFHPQLDECTGCGQHPAERRAFWSARHGGLLCARCLHEDPAAEPAAPYLLEALSAYAEAEGPPYELDARWAGIFQDRLDEFLRWRLDRPLKTLNPEGQKAVTNRS